MDKETIGSVAARERLSKLIKAGEAVFHDKQAGMMQELTEIVASLVQKAVQSEREQLRHDIASELGLLKTSICNVRQQMAIVATDLDRLWLECAKKFEKLDEPTNSESQTRRFQHVRQQGIEAPTYSLSPLATVADDINTALASLMQEMAQKQTLMLDLISRQSKDNLPTAPHDANPPLLNGVGASRTDLTLPSDSTDYEKQNPLGAPLCNSPLKQRTETPRRLSEVGQPSSLQEVAPLGSPVSSCRTLTVNHSAKTLFRSGSETAVSQSPRIVATVQKQSPSGAASYACSYAPAVPTGPVHSRTTPLMYTSAQLMQHQGHEARQHITRFIPVPSGR